LQMELHLSERSCNVVLVGEQASPTTTHIVCVVQRQKDEE
jgi:hypothetical protein